MRSIPGTITQYVKDQDQVEELDLNTADLLTLRRQKAQDRLDKAQAQADEARTIVAAYDEGRFV